MSPSLDNTSPAPVPRADLPSWAFTATGPMSGIEAQRHGGYLASTPRSLASRLALLPMGVGLLYGLGVVSGLIDDLTGAWGLWVVAALFALGAALFGWSRRLSPLRPAGLIMAPDGLVLLHSGAYRCLPREQIHAVRAEANALAVVYGQDERRWLIESSALPECSPQTLAKRASELEEWRAAGVPPQRTILRALPWSSTGRVVRGALGAFAAGAGILAFVWVTAVHPTTSASGQQVSAFVQDVGAHRYDAAYARLTSGLRGRMTREEFEANLPEDLRAATGLRVNSMNAGGGLGCVDGWLDGVEGAPSYAFALVDGPNGEPHIDGWRGGHCIRQQ